MEDEHEVMTGESFIADAMAVYEQGCDYVTALRVGQPWLAAFQAADAHGYTTMSILRRSFISGYLTEAPGKSFDVDFNGVLCGVTDE